jgi:protein SCO1/2
MNRRVLFMAGGTLALAADAALQVAPAAPPKTGARYFTNLELSTHDGRRVRFYDDLLKGKVIMINFMFTGCGDICPGMIQNLVHAQALLGPRVGRDIFMYSITLQPEFDTPEALKAYAEKFEVGPGWTFLTGPPGSIEVLRRRLGFVDSDPDVDADLTQHIGIVRIGNEPLNRWSACPALSEPKVIVQSVLRTIPRAGAIERSGRG